MKNPSRIHKNGSPAVVSAQSKTQDEKSASKVPKRTRAGRRTVRVLMPTFLIDVLEAEAQRTGKSRGEIIEIAVSEGGAR